MADAWRKKVADVAVMSGPSDFRIYQQGPDGRADIEMTGLWSPEPGARDCRVQVRLVSEQDGSPMAPAAAWTTAESSDDGSWRACLRGVPAGGLYQIKTQLAWTNPDGSSGSRLCHIVHHLGVGDLWIIAGQSNASGTGRGLAEDGPELGVHILKNEERWDVAAQPLNDPSHSDHPNRGGAGTSPYLSFAKMLHRALGYPIGLIQTARGGCSLHEYHVEEDPDAPLWRNMLHCVGLAGGRAAGMVWYQGCHDGAVPERPDWAADYEDRFARFIERAREVLGDFALIVSQLNRWSDIPGSEAFDQGWSKVRQVQRRVGRLGRACCVPTVDLSLSDGIHNSSASNFVLGERIARAALGMVYKRPVFWRAPDVRRAVRNDAGDVVEVEFNHVTNSLLFLGTGRKDFLVADTDGPVDVAAAVADGATVRLELARPLGAKARVHLGAGIDPELTLRDAETNLPPLTFSDMPVKRAGRRRGR